jgi:hypothetical protein
MCLWYNQIRNFIFKGHILIVKGFYQYFCAVVAVLIYIKINVLVIGLGLLILCIVIVLIYGIILNWMK